MINKEHPFNEKPEFKQELFLEDGTDPIMDCIPSKLFKGVLDDEFWVHSVFLVQMDRFLDGFVGHLKSNSALKVSEGDRFILVRLKRDAFEKISRCSSLKMEDVLRVNLKELRKMIQYKVKMEKQAENEERMMNDMMSISKQQGMINA